VNSTQERRRRSPGSSPPCFLAAILLLVAPLTAYLPIPAMAGILLLVAASLIDTRHIGHILRVSRAETASSPSPSSRRSSCSWSSRSTSA